MKKPLYNKILVIHPGTQHAYRLANALAESFNIKISLYTWFLLSSSSYLVRFSFFKKRIKNISEKVNISNYPLFELLLLVHLKINKLLNIKNNNAYYLWQNIFGWFLLPLIYFNRKNSILVIFETCGWPITKYAKKWKIPIVMDFASISHESAHELGINESRYGIKIKSLERQYIDYGLNCSNFALNTYKNKTSAKKHFAIWLGTDFKSDYKNQITPHNNALNICCLANTEQRKGIDLLIEAFNKIQTTNKKLYLIGRISTDWVTNYCIKNNFSLENIVLTGPKAQQDLKEFIIKERINLHILPSRFDSFGMVVPETMALGIPNIVSPYVGAGEILEHNKDGFVMQNLDARELTNCINKYVAMPLEEKANLSLSAFQKSKQMTWNNYKTRISKAFTEIITAV